MERVEQGMVAHAPADGALRGVDFPTLLAVWIEQAAAANGSAREQLAGKINSALATIPSNAAGRGRACADFLEAQLGGGKLEALIDREGRSCRAVAVEALLDLGFPYALEVTPEDLEHARANGKRARPSWQALLGLGLVVVAALVQLSGLLEVRSLLDLARGALVRLHAVICLVGTAIVAFTPARTLARRSRIRWLVAVGLLGLALPDSAEVVPIEVVSATMAACWLTWPK